MVAIIMLVGILMMLAIKPFLKVYVAEDYYSAWKYTPFLIIGCVFMTLGKFMSTSYIVHKDSKGFLISGTFGALFNIVLNFLLIPRIGVYGAAFATCVSYIAVFTFRAFHTRKYIHYKVVTFEFLLGTIALVVSGVMMYFDNIWSLMIQILITVIIVYSFKGTWLPMLQAIVRKV